MSKWLVGLASLGWAALVDVAVHAEWTFPYCNTQDDGPAHAVFGFIPYQRFSGVSSLVYDFQPVLFVANLCLLAVLVFGMAAVVKRWVPAVWLARHARWVVTPGVGLLVLATGYHGALLLMGWWVPVWSVGPSAGSYCDYRPVGLSFTRHYDCTPSGFWFEVH